MAATMRLRIVATTLLAVIPLMAALGALGVRTLQVERVERARAEIEVKATSSADELNQAKDELSTTRAECGRLRVRLDDIQAAANKAEMSRVLAEKHLDCPGPKANIDYTSNSTVSESLRRYLEDAEGNVESAKWDVFWSNSKTALHTFRGKYLWLFVVYFDEPDMQYTAEVYDLSHRCYLDRPQEPTSDSAGW